MSRTCSLLILALVRGLFDELKPLGKRNGADGRGCFHRPAVSKSSMNVQPDNSSSILILIQRRREGEHRKNQLENFYRMSENRKGWLHSRARQSWHPSILWWHKTFQNHSRQYSFAGGAPHLRPWRE
mmetsp:Transcript_26665/g.41388  ORF Transcript_26665/g.41388 Transcript_26665/m.41388 type:complete len:127 (+) Transcript_26665:1167-1547(+)